MDLEKKGYLLIFSAVVLWSISGLIIKTVDVSAIWIVFVRSITGGLFLIRFLFKKKIRPVSNLILASISMVLFTLTFTLTTQISTAAMAISMQYTAPMYMGVLNFINFRKIEKDKLLVLVLIFIGTILCMFGSLKSFSLLIILMGMGIGISFLLYSINLHKITEGSPLGIVGAINLLNSIVYMIMILIKPDNPPSTPKDIILLTIAGILISGLSYALYGEGLKITGVDRGIIIALAEPILNPIWVFLGTGEIPNIKIIFGLVFILLGATVDILFSKK